MLQVDCEPFETRYLGLPTPHGRRNRDVFHPIEEKLSKSMMDWGDQYISTAGKKCSSNQ